MGSQIVQRSLTAVTEEHADFFRQKHTNDMNWKCLHKWHFNTVTTQIKLELKHSLMSKNEAKKTKCICVVHRPSGVPQFHQIVKRAREQQMLVWRGPFHSSDPASVGGQGQQHQWAIWWGQETLHEGNTEEEANQPCLGRGRCYLWCEGPTTWCVCLSSPRPGVDTEASRKCSWTL